MALTPLPFRPDIALHKPGPGSGLNAWLAEQGRPDIPPYWAYAWAGGAALSLYLRNHPEVVAGQSVLDFGAGSGLVGIAAARAGARHVLAYEPDSIGATAIALNAASNGVVLTLAGKAETAQVILAGDVFYDAEVARMTLPALRALAGGGARVLVGDPFRRDLPLAKLELIARYSVPDMGGRGLVDAGIFALHP